MLAFHNDPAIKEKYFMRLRAHRAWNEINQGWGSWNNGRGSAVACTIHGSNYRAYESELGIPISLALLEDALFENLAPGKAEEWPESFLLAIQPGADLAHVWSNFVDWMLADPSGGVVRFADENCVGTSFIITKQVSDAIREVAGLARDRCTDERSHQAGAHSLQFVCDVRR